MKRLEEFILEKLKVNKIKPKYKPKNKKELVNLMIKEIQANGPYCSLNHIDVSDIDDMSYLFGFDDTQYVYGKAGVANFDGDISEWDVSNVTSMWEMFYNSKFNGDISSWDVSNVTNMSGMFQNSIFNGDISDWDVSSVKNMSNMFDKSKFNGDISDWDVSSVEVFYSMFRNSIFNGDVSGWKLNPKAKGHIDSIFMNSPLERTLPAWYYKYKI